MWKEVRKKETRFFKKCCMHDVFDPLTTEQDMFLIAIILQVH